MRTVAYVVLGAGVVLAAAPLVPFAGVMLAIALGAWLLTGGSGLFAGRLGGVAVFAIAAPTGALLGPNVFVVALVGLGALWLPQLRRFFGRQPSPR